MQYCLTWAVALATLWMTANALGQVPRNPATQSPTALKINSLRLGNVFIDGDSPGISVDTNAESLEWTLYDAWGAAVLKGTEPVKAHPAVISMPIKQFGYFQLEIDAKSGANVIEHGSTRLAVLSKFDLAEVKDSPFGVVAHISQGWNTEVCDLIEKAGIKNVRDEVPWSGIEKTKGQFDFSAYDPCQAALGEHHLRSLTPLDFGNPLYDRSDVGPAWCIAPYTSEGFTGYARYAQEVVKHFDPQIQAVEIWNEYNGVFAPGPADGKPLVYAEMIKQAYPAIKKVRPDLLVLGCDTAGVPLDWMETVFKNGGMDVMDGVSIHPYSSSPPEWLDTCIPPVKELIRKYNHGRDKPLWVTEDSWGTAPLNTAVKSTAMTEMTKACYLVRAYTILQAQGVDKIFWYLFRDYGEFQGNGLVGSTEDPAGHYAPHQSYVAFATMARQLNGAKFVDRDKTDPAVRSYQYDRGGQAVRVMWAVQAHDVMLTSDQPLAVVDLMGQPHVLKPVAGKVHLGLSEAPLYVIGTVQSIAMDSDISAQVSTEAAIGEPMPLHFTVSTDLASQGLTVLADGVSQKLAFTDEKAQVDLSAAQAPGERWAFYELRANDQTVYLGSALTQVRPTVVFDQFPHLLNLKTLEVRICNVSQTKPLAVQSLTWTVAGIKHDDKFVRQIAPGQTLILPIAVEDLKPWTVYPATIDVTFDGTPPLNWKGQISYNPVIKRTIMIKPNGDLSGWTGVDPIDLSAAPYEKVAGGFTGDADLSGNVWLCWDEKNLYFAARIRDDVFFQDQTGDNVWKGDNIQLGFNAGMPWPGEEFGNGRQELGLTLTPAGPQFYRFSGTGQKTGLVDDVPLVVNRMGEFTIYQCAIPWTQLEPATPTRGNFSFGLFVNDNDGQGRKGYKQWADIKDTAAFQPCYLCP